MLHFGATILDLMKKIQCLLKNHDRRTMTLSSAADLLLDHPSFEEIFLLLQPLDFGHPRVSVRRPRLCAKSLRAKIRQGKSRRGSGVACCNEHAEPVFTQHG